MNDLVSIIMPSYNCAGHLVESIRSVQAQTYQNWELLFVDDCSKDNTIEQVMILKEGDSRIKVLQNQRNCGAAFSRNTALRHARGRWIAFLDSDDVWEPTKLDRQIRFMEENDYAFSYTRYREMGVNSQPTGIKVSGPRHITKASMMSYCWLGCLTVMYDREKVGLIQIANIRKNNCYAMWLKVIRKADCYLLDECLAKYRRGRSGSISTQDYVTLIRWHYKLWHEAEGKNSILSLYYTGLNLVCGFYKKLKYVQKE